GVDDSIEGRKRMALFHFANQPEWRSRAPSMLAQTEQLGDGGGGDGHRALPDQLRCHLVSAGHNCNALPLTPPPRGVSIPRHASPGDLNMRAWAVVENGAPLQEIELPTPEPKGTEVLIEVTHCGVCPSDLHIWDGYYDLGGGNKMSLKDRGVVLPLAMGHEIVGRVAKLGPDAKGVKVGDLRIVFPWVGCGTCDKCRAEEDNMCLTPRSLGVYQNGGYGTHV